MSALGQNPNGASGLAIPVSASADMVWESTPLGRRKATPVHELERYMRCRDCSLVCGYPFKRSHLIALRPTKISAMRIAAENESIADENESLSGVVNAAPPAAVRSNGLLA